MLKACEVCGKEFKWQDFGGRYKNKRYCSRLCNVRAWRTTDKGKALIIKGNIKHKRPDIAQVCAICGAGYTSARVRDICNAVDCQSKAPVYRQEKLRLKNPGITAAYRYTDSLLKKIKRGTLNKPYCSVCGASDKIQFHHPDYTKPTEVIPLCIIHHREWHNKQKD